MCIYDDDSYDSHDDDDSYSSISSSIHPFIYRLIIDMKINISINTLCYSLPGKHCYNHAAVKIMPSSFQNLFIHLSIIIIIATTIIITSSPSIHLSIIHPSIHHYQMSSIHQYFNHVHSLSFDDTSNYCMSTCCVSSGSCSRIYSTYYGW